MREKFYGLLREYLLAVQERDVVEKQAKSAIEGTEREEARQKLDVLKKRCKALRQEIQRYPGVSLSAKAGARK